MRENNIHSFLLKMSNEYNSRIFQQPVSSLTDFRFFSVKTRQALSYLQVKEGLITEQIKVQMKQSNQSSQNLYDKSRCQLNVLVGHKLESDAFWSHAAIFLVTNFPCRIFVQVGEVRVRINHGVVLRHVRVRALVEKGAVN